MTVYSGTSLKVNFIRSYLWEGLKKTEYFSSKNPNKSTSTKPTCITSIFICHRDAKARKQPKPEPSISWTHHIFIISRKMGIDGYWVQFSYQVFHCSYLCERKAPVSQGCYTGNHDFSNGRERNKILLPLFACLGGITCPVQREGESKLAEIRLLFFWVP